MSLVDVVEVGLLGAWFGRRPFSPPTLFYLGLSSTPVLEDGTGITEPNEEGYARVPIPNDSNWWTVGSDVRNARSIEFPTVTDPWLFGAYPIGYVFLTDPDGMVVAGGEIVDPTTGLPSTLLANVFDVVRLEPGALVVSMVGTGSTDVGRAAFLGSYFGLRSLPAPPYWYLGLSLSDILDDGTGVQEPVGEGYARAQVPNSTDDWVLGDGVSNARELLFPKAESAWAGGDPLRAYFFSSTVDGPPMFWGRLLSPDDGTEIEMPVGAGRAPSFAPGDLIIQVD